MISKAQIYDPNYYSSRFVFSEINNYNGQKVKRAILYCSKPRTVTFKLMSFGFNDGPNVLGYLKTSPYGFDNMEWRFQTNRNVTEYVTLNLPSGRNYIELGLEVYIPYSSPSVIVFIDDYSPSVIQGEGIYGSHSGVDNAITVYI